MAIDIKSLDKVWSDAKIKSLREILTKNGAIRPSINDTGKLSQSYRIDLKKTGKGAGIEFKMMFYGKYVRAYYLKKKGLDILAPMRDVKSLIVKIKEELKTGVIKEVLDDLKSLKVSLGANFKK